MSKLFRDASDKIAEIGAIPVFATITTMSLHDWNTTRLKQHKTTHLEHKESYKHMQTYLNTTFENINNTIFQLNEENNVETPHLSRFITTKRGLGHGYRVRYSWLVDGCHPSGTIISKWQSELELVASTNRERHS